MKKYYNSHNITLYHGDSLELLDSIDDIDMVFADPPYNLSNDGFTCKGGRMVSVNKGNWDKSKGIENDHSFDFTWLSKVQNTLKESGSIWVSGTYHNIYSVGFAMQKIGYHTLNEISWFKPNASPNLSCRMFTASHETLIWARKNKKSKHTFNYPVMKQLNGGKQMRSVWEISVTPKKEKAFGHHPTQKPEELLRRIILASTNVGDTILDPFNGSGTTGLVAAKLNRKYIGIELDKKYLDLTIKRIESIKKQPTLSDSLSFATLPV